jgi:dienelactone hydrolase
MRSSPRRHMIVVLAWLALLPACASNMEAVSIPVQTFDGYSPPDRPIPSVLYLPDGAGPFPAIVVLHTCAGPGGAEELWARRLNGWGYAALVANSMAAHGEPPVCSNVAAEHLSPQRKQAGDAINAALWLRRQPRIDGNRIGVIGFSDGGWAASWLTQQHFDDLFPHLLKASVDYYGGCLRPETFGDVPLLSLQGEDDTFGIPIPPAESCRRFQAKLQLRPGQVFELQVYPYAVHEFDNEAVSYHIFGGHPIGYDPDAAKDSFVRVKAFFDRYVRGA